MKKRLLSAVLALCIALTALPPMPVYAANPTNLQEASGTLLNLAANETKTFSFTPQSSGFYVFSFISTSSDFMDYENEFFNISDSRNAQVQSIYTYGLDENYENWDNHNAMNADEYIVKLKAAETYTAQYKNPKNTSAQLVLVASPLSAVGGGAMASVSIPGRTTFTVDGKGNPYQYVDTTGLVKQNRTSPYTAHLERSLIPIKIDHAGWYSFGSESTNEAGGLGVGAGGSGVVSIYNPDLSLFADSNYDMNYTDASFRIPASFYLPAGEFIVLAWDANFEYHTHANSDFIGSNSSFASINMDSTASIGLDQAENYVTFTPLSNGLYTFCANMPEIESWSLFGMKLYTADGEILSSCDADYYTAKLSNYLKGGTTYYLGVSGVGDGITVSVAPSESGAIASFYPANGSTFDFANSEADTKPRISFDREVVSAGGGRASLDFGNGNLQIHRASDGVVVYEVAESSFGVGYSTQVPLWGEGADAQAPKAVRLEGVEPKLDYGTEYYVTMPAGFIRLADGTVSPAIGENDWRFTTKANPQAGSHNLTYDYNDGTYGPFPATSHTVGETITVSSTAPTREGYKFGGWADGGTIYKPGDTFKMPDRDVTLTAVWKVAYTVTYDLNGGTGDIPAEHWAEGETVTVTAQVPTKEGYFFDHWSYGDDTYHSGDPFTMLGKDVTLKAEWSKDGEMAFVQALTEHSLKYADAETKAGIQNGIANLLFKAQFRPNRSASSAVSNLATNYSVSFTGTDIAKWHPQNSENYSQVFNDNKLGTITTASSWGGCKSYGAFCSSYIYGTEGHGVYIFDEVSATTSSVEHVKDYIQKYADPGEWICYWNKLSRGFEHAIVFLGESPDENGFYYASYEGGRNSSGAVHDLNVGYHTYTDFVSNNIYHRAVIFDTNGGSYFKNTAKQLAAMREYVEGQEHIIARLACPVEATISLGNEVLDSRQPGSASFGKVERVGEEIVFTLDYNRDYQCSIAGTGEGVMTMTLEYYKGQDLVDTRTFVKMPIKATTEIQTSAFDPLGDFVLYAVDAIDKDEEATWGAGPNQTVYGPDDIYSSKNNGPSSLDGIDTSTDYTISVQPSSAVPSTDVKVNGQTAATANEGDTVVVTPAAAGSGKRLNVTAAAGSSSVDVTDNGDGTYSFTMPAANVTVTVDTVNVYALTLTQPATLAGSAVLDKTTAAVGDTVTVTVTPSTGFECIGIAVFNDGKQNVSVFENKDAAGKVVSYYFKMPANPKSMEVIPIMQASATANCVYSNSGNFGGQLSFSNLTAGNKYVIQVAKSKDAAHAIMFFTANADGTAVVDVLRNPSGYVVDLFVYDKAISATPTYSQLTTVPVTVTTTK